MKYLTFLSRQILEVKSLILKDNSDSSRKKLPEEPPVSTTLGKLAEKPKAKNLVTLSLSAFSPVVQIGTDTVVHHVYLYFVLPLLSR
jgi:hypothetical protein